MNQGFCCCWARDGEQDPHPRAPSAHITPTGDSPATPTQGQVTEATAPPSSSFGGLRGFCFSLRQEFPIPGYFRRFTERSAAEQFPLTGNPSTALGHFMFHTRGKRRAASLPAQKPSKYQIKIPSSPSSIVCSLLCQPQLLSQSQAIVWKGQFIVSHKS